MQETVTTTTCDHCKEVIQDNEFYMNAGTYGIHLHLICVEGMSAFQVIRILDLDDIKMMTGTDWENAEKAPGWIRRGRRG